LQRVKRLFNAVKAGHTGSLDPLATGMLPVCFGQATKLSGMLLDASKRYRVTAALGSATESGDAEGAVVANSEIPDYDAAALVDVLHSMLGPGMQIPPMYSALKHGGQRLYQLARKGIEIEREPRPIHLHQIVLNEVHWPCFSFDVHCSKGTYIRSLVQDVAIRLGTVGHVAELRRLAVEPFDEAQMITLDDCERCADRGLEVLDRLLLLPDLAIPTMPRLDLDQAEIRRISQGQRIARPVPTVPGGRRLYRPDSSFLGIGEIDGQGEVRPRKLFVP
jgi:tRNA pseudouridine55 synthase